MNLYDMRTEVRRRLDESTVSADFWTDADIDDAINEGYEEISDATEWYETFAILSLYSNQTYYDLRTYLGETFLTPRRTFNNTTHRWLSACDVRDLDFRTSIQWELNTGEPEHQMLRGLWWLGLYPKKGDDAGTLKFYFTGIPQPLTSYDEPGFPHEFQRALVEYALCELLAQAAETKKALAHWAKYQEFEVRFYNYVRNRISLDRVGGFRG
jgi:hypothetical protein